MKPLASTKAGAAVVAAAALLAALAVVPNPAGAAAAYAGTVNAQKPRGMAVDAARELLYVAGKDGDLTIVDTHAFATVTTVPLTCCLTDVALDTAGEKVWVSGNGVIVLDQATNVVEDTISVAPDAADAIVFDATTQRVYVALPNADKIAVIDAVTRTLLTRWNAGDRPESLALSGTHLLSANLGDGTVTAIDTATGDTVATAIVASPVALAADPTTNVFYVASAYGSGAVEMRNRDNLGLIRSMWTGNMPGGLAFNPGNGRLWVTDSLGDTTAMMRSSDGVVLGRIPIGNRPATAVFDAHSARTYVAMPESSQVIALGEGPGIVSIELPFQNGFARPGSMKISGKAPAGSPVSVEENGTQLGWTYASTSSNWTINVVLPEGPHSVAAFVPEEAPSPLRSFTVDLTPPNIVETSRTPPNASGWNNGAVLVHWECADSVSGTTTPAFDKVLFLDGANQSTAVTCKDRAGNSKTYTSTGFSIDRTPPVVTTLHSPAANSAGWNRTSPVTVKLTCSDTLSGLAPNQPVVQQTVTGNTPGVNVATSCADKAGNVKGKVEPVRIDVSPPEVTVDAKVVPLIAPLLPLTGTAVDGPSGAWTFEAQLTDVNGLSDVWPAQCAASCDSSETYWKLDGPPQVLPGLYEISVRASDLAGNVGQWSPPVQYLVVPLLNPRSPPGLPPVPTPVP